MNECEVKVLEIDRAAIERQLRKLGATCVADEELHSTYYTEPLGREHIVLRLRQEGNTTVLTVKEPQTHANINVSTETEITVDDYERTRTILKTLGATERSHAHKQRRTWKIHSSHVIFDKLLGTHQQIPEYLEIEANTPEEVHTIAAQLGIPHEALRAWTGKQVLEHYATYQNRRTESTTPL